MVWGLPREIATAFCESLAMRGLCPRNDGTPRNYNEITNMKQPAVYIVTNKKNGVLYTGVTSNIIKRIYEHKYSIKKGFTAKYNCKLLVFFEMH